MNKKENSVTDRQSAERILVPVANPRYVKELMDLAILFNSRKELSIYPLTIVNKIAGNEENLSVANELLEKSVQNLVTRHVYVEPVIRSDINIASGISKVMDERKIDITIIGWNRDPVKGSRIFSTILDQLLILTTRMLLVCNTKQVINAHNRIILAIPPESYREPGFQELIEKTLNLAVSAQLEIRVVTEYSQSAEIKKVIEDSGIDANLSYESVTLWEDLHDVMERKLKRGDLIFLIGSRKETISWSYDSDALPGTISERFPDNSLVVAYPRIKNATYNSYFDP